jgi:hypothetical protein
MNYNCHHSCKICSSNIFRVEYIPVANLWLISKSQPFLGVQDL